MPLRSGWPSRAAHVTTCTGVPSYTGVPCRAIACPAAMKMAVGRDQLHFSLGFYSLMLVANVVRVCRYRRIELLPINYVPFCIGPVMFAYNVDASYGNKMERLNIEKETILRTENHWFNKPIALPVSMEADYRKLMAETNDRLMQMGCPPERDWAVFSPYFSDDDLWRSASPLSRMLHEQLRRHDSVAPVE
mmetsp:Transcript_11589/g.30168  ORF Transcript_11589/g.30168 Transcript_11589/m.30168 type:complete len:191 (+) Transcript_11589:247-819(+)